MTTLARRLADTDVLDVLDRFHRDLGSLMQGPSGDRAQMWQPGGLEIWEDDQSVYVAAELPGVKSEDVDITLEGSVLTIRGEKKEKKPEKQQVQYHYRQRRYGPFVLQFQLPSTVDGSKVTASMRDGVLRVQLEKRAEVKPRKVEIKAG